jgi:hypothetical protein
MRTQTSSVGLPRLTRLLGRRTGLWLGRRTGLWLGRRTGLWLTILLLGVLLLGVLLLGVLLLGVLLLGGELLHGVLLLVHNTSLRLAILPVDERRLRRLSVYDDGLIPPACAAKKDAADDAQDESSGRDTGDDADVCLQHKQAFHANIPNNASNKPLACLAPAALGKVAGEEAGATVTDYVKRFSAFLERSGTSHDFISFNRRTCLVRGGDRDAQGKKDHLGEHEV